MILYKGVNSTDNRNILAKSNNQKSFQEGGPLSKYPHSYEIDANDPYLAQLQKDRSNWLPYQNHPGWFTAFSEPGQYTIEFDETTGKYYYAQPMASGAAESTMDPVTGAVAMAGMPAYLGSALALGRLGQNMKQAYNIKVTKPAPAKPIVTPTSTAPPPPALPPAAMNTKPVQYPRGINWTYGGTTNAKPVTDMVPFVEGAGQAASQAKNVISPIFHGGVQAANTAAIASNTAAIASNGILYNRTSLPAVPQRNVEAQIAPTNKEMPMTKSDTAVSTVDEGPSFSEEFARQRRARIAAGGVGDEVFDWRGNSYHTRTVEEDAVYKDKQNYQPLAALSSKSTTLSNPAKADLGPTRDTTPVPTKKERRKAKRKQRRSKKGKGGILI